MTGRTLLILMIGLSLPAFPGAWTSRAGAVAVADRPRPKSLSPRLVARLVAQLRGRPWEERSAAVAELKELAAGRKADGMGEFAPLVEPLFGMVGWGGEAGKASRAAADLLVRIGAPAVPLLRDQLKSPEARRRWSAVTLLARIGPADAALIDLLRPLLADGDGYVRRTTIDALGGLGPKAARAAADLEKTTQDPLVVNRIQAHVALIRVAGDDRQVRALAAYLAVRNCPEGSAASAAEHLGNLGKRARAALPQLVAALKHPESQVRVNAAAAVGRVGADTQAAIKALIDLLQGDPETQVRRSAAAALGAIGPRAKAAIPALRNALRKEQGGWWVAAAALGQIGGVEAVTALVDALNNKDPDVRMEASRQLGNLGRLALPAVQPLRKARQDPEAVVRKAAARALFKIEGRSR
jgi:HEAT repeat protein